MIAFKELLVRAKRGEEKAFEELFEQFEPLVRKCSYMNGHTDEDLRQILLMEFVQAIRQVQNIKARGGRSQGFSPLHYKRMLKLRQIMFFLKAQNSILEIV